MRRRKLLRNNNIGVILYLSTNMPLYLFAMGLQGCFPFYSETPYEFWWLRKSLPITNSFNTVLNNRKHLLYTTRLLHTMMVCFSRSCDRWSFLTKRHRLQYWDEKSQEIKNKHEERTEKSSNETE